MSSSLRSGIGDSRIIPVENLAINPSFERVSTGSTVLRRNIAAYNTRAQVAAFSLNVNNTAGLSDNRWFGNSGSGIRSRETSDGPTPELSAYLRKTWTGAPISSADCGFTLTRGYQADTSQSTTTSGIAVTPGKTYTISVYARGTLKAGYRIQMAFRDSSGAYISTSVPANITNPSGWVRVASTVTAPLNAAYMEGILYVGPSVLPQPGDTLDATGLLIEERPAPALPYFDGSSTDNSGITYAWEGMVNASTSVVKAAAQEVRRNLESIPNPNLTYGAGIPATGTRSTQTTDTPFGTLQHWKIVSDGSTTAMGFDSAVVLNVAAGFTGIRSCYVRLSKAASVTAQPIGSAAVGITNATAPTIAVAANTWTRVYISGTTTVAGDFGIRLRTTGATTFVSGDTMEVGAMLTETGTLLLPYFDGNITPDADLTPSWLGTANASASNIAGCRLNNSPITYGGAVIRSWKNIIRGGGSARFISNVSTAAESMFFAAGSFTDITTMKPGVTYTAIAKVRILAPQTTFDATRSRKLWLRWSGPSPGTASSPQAPNVAGDYVLRVTSTIPANATGAMVQCNTFAPANDGDLIWDEFAIIQGVYTGPYLDGDMPGCVWRGTLNNSTSIGYPSNV